MFFVNYVALNSENDPLFLPIGLKSNILVEKPYNRRCYNVTKAMLMA